jgi:hypothetical protein
MFGGYDRRAKILLQRGPDDWAGHVPHLVQHCPSPSIPTPGAGSNRDADHRLMFTRSHHGPDADRPQFRSDNGRWRRLPRERIAWPADDSGSTPLPGLTFLPGASLAVAGVQRGDRRVEGTGGGDLLRRTRSAEALRCTPGPSIPLAHRSQAPQLPGSGSGAEAPWRSRRHGRSGPTSA